MAFCTLSFVCISRICRFLVPTARSNIDIPRVNKSFAGLEIVATHYVMKALDPLYSSRDE